MLRNVYSTGEEALAKQTSALTTAATDITTKTFIIAVGYSAMLHSVCHYAAAVCLTYTPQRAQNGA